MLSAPKTRRWKRCQVFVESPGSLCSRVRSPSSLAKTRLFIDLLFLPSSTWKHSDLRCCQWWCHWPMVKVKRRNCCQVAGLPSGLNLSGFYSVVSLLFYKLCVCFICFLLLLFVSLIFLICLNSIFLLPSRRPSLRSEFVFLQSSSFTPLSYQFSFFIICFLLIFISLPFFISLNYVFFATGSYFHPVFLQGSTSCIIQDEEPF